jgi:hypothetical protein
VNLLAVHRVLIGTFIACALLFGALMARRGGAAGTAAAAVAAVVAILGIAYLAKARHLRRK